MDKWRDELKAKDVDNVISQSAIDELIAIAGQQIAFYYRRPKRLSPALVARELAQLAKALARAEKAIETLGAQGVIHIHAASQASTDIDDFDAFVQCAQVLSLSRWVTRAAEQMKTEKNWQWIPKRGPSPDLNLRSLVTVLAQQFALLLPIRPTYTSPYVTGQGRSLFDEFLKAAFADLAPAGEVPEWAQIDEAIRQELRWLRRFSDLFGPERRPYKNTETRT